MRTVNNALCHAIVEQVLKMILATMPIPNILHSESSNDGGGVC